MKRKFVKPEIRTYQVDSATGQDSLLGICEYGSFAGAETGTCNAGDNPAGGNCYPGIRPSGNVCGSGNNVFPGAQCSPGTNNIPRLNECTSGNTANI